SHRLSRPRRTIADSLDIRRILTCGFGFWRTGWTDGIGLRIRRLGVRVPPSAPRSLAPTHSWEGPFRAGGSHVGSHSSRFRPKQRLAHGRGDGLPAQPAADQLVLPTPNRGADPSSSPTTVQLRPTAFDGGPVAANWDGRPRGDGDGLVRQHPFGL